MQQPQQPSITVSAPILLKILMTVKRSHEDLQESILTNLVKGEITELIRTIEDEVLTPKWSRIVNDEVETVFKDAIKPKLVDDDRKDVKTK